jgi:hypothetical protein
MSGRGRRPRAASPLIRRLAAEGVPKAVITARSWDREDDGVDGGPVRDVAA